MVRKKTIVSICLILLGILGTCIYFNKRDAHNAGHLLINEVCSSNQTIVHNGIGEYPDYVELYNDSDEAIDLSEYCLSDKEEWLDRYHLPKESIQPGEYKLLFMDTYSAGFKIDDDESLYLSDTEGNIIDFVKLLSMEPDMAYARNVETLKWEMGQMPSPGEENRKIGDGIKKIQDENATPVFSVESGFFEEDFYLEIYADNQYEIYYTLDGSTPTEDSFCYDEPILITDVSKNENVYSAITNISTNIDNVELPEYLVDKCNVVRAIAVDADGAVSEEAYATYFVGFEDGYGYNDIYIMSLVTDPDNLFSYERGIYVPGEVAEKGVYTNSDSGDAHELLANYSVEGKGWHRPAYIELFDKNRESVGEHYVDISIHGNYSAMQPQKSFNLLPRTEMGEEYLFEGLLADKSTSLMLRAGGTMDWRYTKFRDILCHILVEDRDLTVQNGFPCQVFMDGEYWGMYNLQERIDQGLVAENFGINAEDVIVLKNENVIGEDDAYYQLYSDVVAYAVSHDLTLDEYYAEIENMIDIQSYIDYYCFEIYIANCDSVVNNFSCWRTKNISDEEYYDGKWRWIVYDTDGSTAGYKGLTEPEVDSFSGGHLKVAPMEDALFTSLIRNETFKYQFVSTFIEMADTNFEPSHVSTVIDELCEAYMEGAVISYHRYNHDEYSEEQYLERVYKVKDFFERRREYIIQHLENNLGIGDVEEYLRAGMYWGHVA